VIVHRGGGRAGSTNSYTVITGIHNPGQTVTPDNLSGGDTRDRPPLTPLYPGTPDTAVSPDPPGNHQGTAAPAGPRANLEAAWSTAAEAGVGEFFDRLASVSPLWRLTAAQRRRLAPAAAAALAAGWAPAALAEFAGANTAGIRNPGAVLAVRLSPAELPPRPPRPARPPWCGACDEVTRMLDYDGDAPRPCPRCKPKTAEGGRELRRVPSAARELRRRPQVRDRQRRGPCTGTGDANARGPR